MVLPKGMLVDNAIEVFNCSLCSFCETSLDGLTRHIRNHIKPEPALPAGSHVNLVAASATASRSNGAVSHTGISKEFSSPLNSVVPHSDSNVQNRVVANPLSPIIEVTNPRTVTPMSSRLNSRDPEPFSSCKSSTVAEKSSPSHSRVPQPTVRHVNSSVAAGNGQDNMHTTRYIQLTSRDGPYVEVPSSYAFANPYVTNINSKTAIPRHDLVPIAPVKTSTQDFQGAPSRELIYRSLTDHHAVIDKGLLNRPTFPTSVGQVRVHTPKDVPLRVTRPPDLTNQTFHHSFQSAPIVAKDRTTVYQTIYHTPKPRAAQGGVALPPYSHAVTQPPAEDNAKNCHNTLGNIQLSGASIPQRTQSTMGMPNNGTIILSPQVLTAAGNCSIDQLAGLLVVPLKKTSDAACQTDPVVIEGSDTSHKHSRSVQTDLPIERADQRKAMLDSFRVTDDLFECVVCGDEFASDHHLQEHMAKQHTYVCDKCYHSSTNVSDHNAHLSECGNGEMEMICMECNTSFSSLRKMHQHRSKAHSVRMPFRCGVCDIPFETHEAVMEHIDTHDTDVMRFKCRYCIKVFQTADGLSKHFARHESVGVLHECRFCKKAHSTRKLLEDHISYVHVIREDDAAKEDDTVFAFDSPSKKDEPIELSPKKYPLCQHCDLSFKNSDLLKQHLDICIKNSEVKLSSFVCDVCKECYPSEARKRDHIRKEHKRDTGFRCRKCSKVYRTWSRLKFHTKQQHLKRSCPDCSLIFTKEHVLRKHQEDKHGKPQGQTSARVYTCSICNTMKHTLTDLMHHRKEVHPELSGMRTADQSSSATMLSYIDKNSDEVDSNHIDSNDESTADQVSSTRSPSKQPPSLGQHPFRCNLCGSNFDDEKRLKNHRGLIHGEKPFKCKECQKSFLYSSQVLWHMRSHRKKSTKVSSKLWKSKNKKFVSKLAKQRPGGFTCQFCGDRFSQEKLLNNHKGAVHKIKLFACDICGTRYGHSTELIWHVRVCRQKFQRDHPGLPLPTGKGRSTENDMDDDGFVCHVCAGEFALFEDYQDHMRTHPGEEVPSRDRSIAHTKRKANSSPAVSPTKKVRNESQNGISPSPHIANDSVMSLLEQEPEFDDNVGEYVCPVCQRTTKSMTGMKTHYGRVHGVWSKESSHKVEGQATAPVGEVSDDMWPCGNCDRQFASLSSLRHHSTIIHSLSVNEEDVAATRKKIAATPGDNRRVTYACRQCDVIFSYSKSLKAHATRKHGVRLTDDDVSRCKTVGGMKSTHATDPDDTVRFRCPKCKTKVFRSTKALRAHSRKRHDYIPTKSELLKTKVQLKPDGQFTKYDSSKEVYPCGECQRVFMNRRAQFTHYRQAHRDAIVPLPPPKRPSRNEITAYRNSEEAQEDRAPAKESRGVSSKKNYVRKVASLDCPKCGNTFHHNRAFYAHLYASHGVTKDHYAKYWPDGMPVITEKDSTCPTCNKQCIDTRAMRIHIFKAHGVLSKNMNKSVEVAETEETAEADETENSKAAEDKDEVGDALVYSDNELRVVEAEEGPPICFICGRSFKTRRALMTHEYKYHGIRWVGNKRIFPHQVRNVPNLTPVLKPLPPRNFERSLLKMSNDQTADDTNITQPDENGLLENSQENSSNHSDSPNPELDSLLDTPPVERIYNVLCPRSSCSSRFHNRRALTTHLCRVHKYKKKAIHKLFKMQDEMEDVVGHTQSERDDADGHAQDYEDDFDGQGSLNNGEVYVLNNDNSIVMCEKGITFVKDSDVGTVNEDIDLFADNGLIEDSVDIADRVKIEPETEGDAYMNGDMDHSDGELYIDVM